MGRPLSVLLAEGVPGDRTLLRRRMERDGEFRIVGEAATAGEAITLSASLQPDAVVVDLAPERPEGDRAIEGIRRLSPTSKIVALSESPRVDEPSVVAYVSKHTSPSDVTSALISLYPSY